MIIKNINKQIYAFRETISKKGWHSFIASPSCSRAYECKTLSSRQYSILDAVSASHGHVRESVRVQQPASPAGLHHEVTKYQ